MITARIKKKYLKIIIIDQNAGDWHESCKEIAHPL